MSDGELRYSRTLIVVHWITALVVLLIAVPLTGWYATGRLGISIAVKGVALPGLAMVDVHQIGGNLFLIVAGLHAVMARWHHFVKRDATERRMNPF